VFFVDEIQIFGPNMDKVRVTTLLKGSFNVFAFARMNFFERNIAREYVFEMKDCGLSEMDNPNSPIIRLQMGDKKFYAYRNRTMMIN
jgi:hypothetical protein